VAWNLRMRKRREPTMVSSSLVHGNRATCKSCRRRDHQMHGQGHPAPCDRVRWQDQRHHTPTPSAGGCNGFEAAAEPAPV